MLVSACLLVNCVNSIGVSVWTACCQVARMSVSVVLFIVLGAAVFAIVLVCASLFMSVGLFVG